MGKDSFLAGGVRDQTDLHFGQFLQRPEDCQSKYSSDFGVVLPNLLGHHEELTSSAARARGLPPHPRDARDQHRKSGVCKLV